MAVVPTQRPRVEVSGDLPLSGRIELLINLAFPLIKHNMDLLSDLWWELQDGLAINLRGFCTSETDRLDQDA